MRNIPFFFRIWAFIFLLQSHIAICVDSIPSVTLENLALEDEGFLWKRSLIVDKESSDLSFEQTHAKLYHSLRTFQEQLNKINIVELVQGIILDPSCPFELKTFFMELNDDGQKIADYMEQNLDPTEDLFKNEKVRTILRRNFERLKHRNACNAALEYISETGERVEIPILSEDKKKPIIFLSGIGNEIIRILLSSPPQ
ncbi:MAG: hypothetical protein FJX03_01495 [Alphaproteobacteria bacterium]|nr:hypothetical protein [Alphaproteobacteria bacterium]